MGLNQLHASSRPKLQPNPTSKANLTPASFDNVHVPDVKSPEKEGTLRTIVIDGQNVAVEHAKGNTSKSLCNTDSGKIVNSNINFPFYSKYFPFLQLTEDL